jgi:CO/xanthine dehydrogenase FAD-binding subunit
VLLVLEAEVTLAGMETCPTWAPEPRRIPLAQLLAQGTQGGLITEVVVPRPGEGTGLAFHKVGRTPSDSAIVSVAALLVMTEGDGGEGDGRRSPDRALVVMGEGLPTEPRGGLCRRARLAVGGIGPVPQRLLSVEALLEGQVLSQALIEQAARAVPAAGVAWPSDFRASAEYRREMAVVLATRALGQTWSRTTACSQP